MLWVLCVYRFHHLSQKKAASKMLPTEHVRDQFLQRKHIFSFSARYHVDLIISVFFFIHSSIHCIMIDSFNINANGNADLKVNNISSFGQQHIGVFITIQHKLETDKKLLQNCRFLKCSLYRIIKTENCAVSTEISNSCVQDNNINYTQNLLIVH